MDPGLEKVKVGGSWKVICREREGFLPAAFAAAGLLQGQALNGWQQEDLTPTWPTSATAFIRGGKEMAKKSLVTQDSLLMAKNCGKASLIS